jgi:hypothetical protein
MADQGTAPGGRLTREQFLELVAAGAAGAALERVAAPAAAAQRPRPQVAAYYFPQWHVDPRNEGWFGRGWSEWELLARAVPRFPAHRQPKRPLWGFEDESRPDVHARKIDAAADHGLDAFIYDWYWYVDGPLLQRGLEQGFLRAGNNARMKFALMWANHDWNNLFPVHRANPVNTLRSNGRTMTGAVDRAIFDRATDHVIATYLGHRSYWRPDGRAYFSIYQVETLVDGLGGVEPTRAALDDFRERAARAGAGELHLNAVTIGVGHTDPAAIERRNELLERLGLDSVTSYVWIHHIGFTRHPATPYSEMREQAPDVWDAFTEGLRLPYFPNVTMGWDSSPRTAQSDVFENLGYPFTPVLEGNTPRDFELALRAAKDFVQSRTDPPVVTVNAWNEWTEGSYLEPDRESGMGYLQALKRVFGGGSDA